MNKNIKAFKFPKGTIVHIEGVPFEVRKVYGTETNYQIAQINLRAQKERDKQNVPQIRPENSAFLHGMDGATT